MTFFGLQNVNKVPQETREAYFLLGLCAATGAASGTRATCRTTEDEGAISTEEEEEGWGLRGRWREGGVGEQRGSEAGGRNPCAAVGEGATGAKKVGAGTEDGDGEEDILRGRGESGEEVDRWGLVVAAPPGTGGVTPRVAAGARLDAAALTLESGFVLATAEAAVSGGSGAALAAESAGAGHCAAGTEGLLGAAWVFTAVVAAGASASGGVEDLGFLPSEGDGTPLSSTGLL